jgi:hypothetical protein
VFHSRRLLIRVRFRVRAAYDPPNDARTLYGLESSAAYTGENEDREQKASYYRRRCGG